MEPAFLLAAVGAVRRVAVGTMRMTLRLSRTIGTLLSVALLSVALLAGGLRSGPILTGAVVAIFATLAFETAVRLERP